MHWFKQEQLIEIVSFLIEHKRHSLKKQLTFHHRYLRRNISLLTSEFVYHVNLLLMNCSPNLLYNFSGNSFLFTGS